MHVELRLRMAVAGLLLFCAIFGPVVAYRSWTAPQHIQETRAKGVETTANIWASSWYPGWLVGNHYHLGLEWSDTIGGVHKVYLVPISQAFAESIFTEPISRWAHPKTTRNTVQIKYSQRAPTEGVVVLDDPTWADDYLANARWMFWFSLLASVIAIPGAIAYWIHLPRHVWPLLMKV